MLTEGVGEWRSWAARGVVVRSESNWLGCEGLMSCGPSVASSL